MAARSGLRAVLAVLVIFPGAMPAPFRPAVAQSDSPQSPCALIALPVTQSPPTMNPPREWQGRTATMRAMVAPGGAVESIAIVESSGSTTLDQAAMAHVKRAWRWQPMLCNTSNVEQRVTVRIPNLGCMAQPIGNTITAPATPPLPRGEGRTAGIAVTLDRDGRARRVRITRSSGDAKLDAAAVAHVEENWRYWPLSGCVSALSLVNIAFPVVACEAVPLRETQTAPETEPLPEGQGRSAEMRVAVGSDGKVQRVAVTRSSGMPELDQAGMAHVQTSWRWQPFVCSADARTAESLETLVSIDFPVLLPPSWANSPGK